MTIFASFVIFLTLYLVSEWQRRQQRCKYIMLNMQKNMDEMKLAIGKRLLPVIETCWRDAMALTEFDL